MIQHYFGLLGCMMILAALPLSVIRVPRFPRAMTLGVFFAMTVVAMVPIDGLMLVGWLRAVIGNLSITSMVLLGLYIVRAYCGCDYFRRLNRHLLYPGLLVMALLLYPMALGLGYFDPYALGYGSLWLWVPLFALAGLLWWRRLRFLLGVLLLAIAAYLLRLLESDNLWDYLIDPWLALVSLGMTAYQLSMRMKGTNG